MGRRRPIDIPSWTLYRRSFAFVVLALVVLLAASFRPDAPAQSSLPPSFTNEHAQDLIERARHFDATFPDRMPGSTGALDSAQWMQDEFRRIGLDARTVPTTSADPATGASIGLVNVEGVLRGRTPELIVVHAHRDAADASGRGATPSGRWCSCSWQKNWPQRVIDAGHTCSSPPMARR